MPRRKKTDRVQLPVRLHEALRARIEVSAKEHGISLNAEVVRRLEQSFQTEEHLARMEQAIVTDAVQELLKMTFKEQISSAVTKAGKELSEYIENEEFEDDIDAAIKEKEQKQ